MNNNSVKWVGQSYERGNNTFSDCSFNIVPHFRPNRNNQYTIEFNECSFYDNSPTIEDGDNFDIYFYLNPGAEVKDADDNLTDLTDIRFRLNVEVQQDIYTYRDTPNKTKIINIFNISETNLYNGAKSYDDKVFLIVKLFCQNDRDTANDKEEYEGYFIDDDGITQHKYTADMLISSLQLYQDDEKTLLNNGSENFVQRILYSINFKYELDEHYFNSEYDEGENITNYEADISTPCFCCSDNFCYLINNLTYGLEATNPDKIYDSETSKFINNNENGNYVRYFNFYNFRLGGPYRYILICSADSEQKTMNDKNQEFNIVACSQNTSTYHNEPMNIQSTMRIKSNDLTNFRIELLDDQFNKIKLHCPVQYMLTIFNEDEY